ncbi:uncharacterized protein Z518_07495 [Rhinocladiella mackenziei CBS 650.93]|uniref:Ankyrin repeat protein n=1 Tax=Rhinocladiella mackenziei CBS 650.93 TaxID=1442369 RepID=A0A0D2FP92_9EURO|nr:uncharacterized protein Z518_07495 [Rhinocladiella mackenziei CBS 650.93]KIX03942.1 hypothetical protein Z518_07495 [Rhinocladiella mackenziei CBS 650.93]
MELPSIPVPITEFVEYANKHPQSHAGVAEAVKPFKAFETKLREIYAQHPNHPAVNANHLVSVFKNTPVTIRARDIANESTADKDKYLLPLSDDLRRKNGSLATVSSLKEFKTNFNLFSESSLVDLDWTNVVVAGSAVVTSLLPVEAPHNESKATYYHEKLAPASDVDLFLYGLDEEQAIEKIKQIESRIRDSILAETTTIRTKNAITIVSEYPTRHVQIVLRLYKSISEVLTGFDVDCACVAYDGQQVWASPRALAAFMTQMNTIDLTRRSPSYENRLSKYSHRGFEVYWPEIDRSRVDPTIFERSFSRVQGLARLLVLEQLPHPNDRDTYLTQRRQERGRPPLPRNARFRHQLPGNVKDAQPDDVADWVDEEEVSNYHTVSIPYGPKYNAKRVEKLLFTKDLLLNAEWNRPKDRETKLHRHPAFFGSVNDVIHDCCGFCPEPTTDEDFAALEEESKLYVSGGVSFLKDDPGRQAIGSFHPITDVDWTEMAYVGNTTRLCQAIVEQDLDAVKDWFSSTEGADVNRRDHAGRTPLQLAVMCSTPEIVRYLIDHDARIVSRLYNGMTALHIAALRGEVRMVKDLLDKSEANEKEESRKEEARKHARRANAHNEAGRTEPSEAGASDSFDSEEDFHDEDDEADDVTEGSFVRVEKTTEANDVLTEDKGGPDVYDVDVLAWDSPLSPLHLAILAGHIPIIDVLIDGYGADVLLPVKIMDQYNRKNAKAAILTIILALELPLQQANEVIKNLLAHGATSTQADMNHVSALHYAVSNAKALILETLQTADSAAFTKAANFIAISGCWTSPNVDAPILSAIRTGNTGVVNSLVAMGAKTHIDFEVFARTYKRSFDTTLDDPTEVRKLYQKHVEQPIIVAMKMEMIDLVNQLVDNGEDVNTLPKEAYAYLDHEYWRGEDKSLLDLVRSRVEFLKKTLDTEKDKQLKKPESLGKDEQYLNFDQGSYQYWTAYHDLRDAKLLHRYQTQQYADKLASQKPASEEGNKEREAAVKATISKLVELSEKLVKKGAKTFYELHEDVTKPDNRMRQYYGGNGGYNTEPYKTNISFIVLDLTTEKKADYIRLFEAAWKGDSDTVRSLCLSGTCPLQVAVTDLRGFSPFSIATLRGHYDLAKLVVEIATVQYQPGEKSERYHYSLRAERGYDDDSECSDDGEGSEKGDHIGVLAQIINETFTVDDVAALADNVKSKVSPATMVSWGCQVSRAVDDSVDEQEVQQCLGGMFAPSVYVAGHSHQSWAWFNAAFENFSTLNRQSLIRYAIFTDNMSLLKFLIKIHKDLETQKEDGDSSRVAHIVKDDFVLAFYLGRVEMIGEIIRTTGFGFPLQKMFQKSGVNLDEKPKYYQGLTVHGKKRQDWAEAGRKGSRPKQVESDMGIPLLVAIVEGNLETTDYFLSDAPLRRYMEFAESFKNDKRIQGLAHTEGGIQGTLNAWLSTRNSFALHVGVLSRPTEDGSQPTFDFLLEKMPQSLEVRTADGRTPLHLAFEVGRYYAARKLIAAGANQATKDHKGRNILHTILDTIDPHKHALLRSVLGILDQKIIPPLLLERCGGTETAGTTPLALFLGHIHSATGWEESVKIVLSYSNGKDLEKINGAGDYPLHSLIRRGHQQLVKFIVEYRPGLLYWENATGMTPSDVVTTSYLRHHIDHPPRLVNTDGWSIKNKPAIEFVKKGPMASKAETEDGVNRSIEWQMYRLINSLMAKHPAKRKLIALHDANEVAKRLALQQQKKNEENRRRERLGLKAARLRRGRCNGQPRNDTNSEQQDDITDYLHHAQRFTKWDEMVWRKTEARETGKEIEEEYSISENIWGWPNDNQFYKRKPAKRSVLGGDMPRMKL